MNTHKETIPLFSHFPQTVRDAYMYSRVAESFKDVQEAIFLNESKMCVQAITEVLSNLPSGDNSKSAVVGDGDEIIGDTSLTKKDAKILDIGAGKGQIGQLLSEQGYTEIYGQEGSDAKKEYLMQKGHYKGIETFIVGKQSLPKIYRRQFDVVTCAGGLGTNLLPAICFKDMLKALKPRGHAIFTVSQKHLKHNNTFNMRYGEAIERLIEAGMWHPLQYN